jgi:hypothetical protein
VTRELFRLLQRFFNLLEAFHCVGIFLDTNRPRGCDSMTKAFQAKHLIHFFHVAIFVFWDFGLYVKIVFFLARWCKKLGSKNGGLETSDVRQL